MSVRCAPRLYTALLLATLLLPAAQAASTDWRRAGSVSVNSKVLDQASFLEKGRSRLFPFAALAQALGREAAADASGGGRWGKHALKAGTLVTVEGVAYIRWRDLSHLEPSLQYGISGQQAVFSLGQATGKRPLAAPAASESAATGTAEWTEDYAAALSSARSSSKRLLLDFTGSNWCGWCKKLDAEIFASAEFKAYAAQNLVLVKVDFPRGIPQSEALKKQNAELQARYGISGYPSLIMLSPDEKVLGQTGYTGASPAEYCKALDEMR